MARNYTRFTIAILAVTLSAYAGTAYGLDLTGTNLTNTTTLSTNVTNLVNSTLSTNVTDTSGTLSAGNTLGLPLPNETISVGASSEVAGVLAYGNGTIRTSVNGVDMSFFFDPKRPTGGPGGSGSLSLDVITDDQAGNEIGGIYIELQNKDGKDVATQYSPASFSVAAGQEYIVYANSYGHTVFDHWEDGSTNPSRAVTPSQSTTLVAYYSTGSTVPNPPTGLGASAASSSQINLAWTEPSPNGGSAVTGYKIERSTNGGSTWSTIAQDTGSTGTTYSDTGLLPSTAYAYRVSAVSSAGPSQPSNTATATTASQQGDSITKVQSGLVASDSLTNETMTQQQLAASPGYWKYQGDAPAENAPYSFSRDSSGLHISVQAPQDGTWAGFFAESPNHDAKVWNSVITNPVRTTQSQYYENGLYVQTANGSLNYITCSTLSNTQATVWTVINATGNTNQVTSYEVLYMDTSPNQQLTRDCAIITNGSNYLAVYLDGKQVYSSTTDNLQMPEPFNAYLEPETSDGKEMLVGTFTNYYVAADQFVKVTGLPDGSRADIVDGSGTVLASGQASGGTASIGVGQYLFPIAATLKVYDSSNNLLASSDQNIYGGDVYSFSASGTSGGGSGGQPGGITLDNVQSTSGVTSPSHQVVLPGFSTGTGMDKLLVVGISANSNNPVSVTFGGTPLAQAAGSFYSNDAELWYLKNPGSSGDIVVTMAGPTQAVVGAYAFANVDLTDPIPTKVATHSTSAGSPSVSVTTKYARDWVLDLPSMWGGETLSAPTCTQQWDVNMAGAITGASSSITVPSPTTISCGWHASSTDMWDDVAVELKALQ